MVKIATTFGPELRAAAAAAAKQARALMSTQASPSANAGILKTESELEKHEKIKENLPSGFKRNSSSIYPS